MSLLALMSLVILRSMVRSGPAGADPAAAATSGDFPATIPMNREDGEEKKEPLTARSRLRRRGPDGPSLRDELAEIVKEDPDAAVNILRTWIGNAS
jgi:flagellar biosynthesis/type III secretory pathway M-ring protein FliF/YscJ